MAFDKLSLDKKILLAIQEAGYTTPTPVQAKVIPIVFDGKDILASAQTGTGKTAAFILPAIQKLLSNPINARSKGPRVLVLTPTRELALQVAQAAQIYCKYFPKISIVSIVGGIPYDRQRGKLSRFVDIMIATPGRLQDFINQGKIDFSRLEMFILDEADRMLDMGFREPVKQIAQKLPTTRQTLLFSATLDKSINELSKGLLKNPERVEIDAPKEQHRNIKQKLLYVENLSSKKKALSNLIAHKEVNQAIIFTATKRSANELARDLDREGVDVGALHGDMSQGVRNRTIKAMKNGAIKVLVATDVAARGIDVKGLSHIFNFDLPRNNEDYVHRIGRTGRAGMNGIAISLAYHRERQLVRRIESFTGQKIDIIKSQNAQTKQNFNLRH
jgi:superfamily II DNA/RNA helicase